jgi:hypothetical protein
VHPDDHRVDENPMSPSVSTCDRFATGTPMLMSSWWL